jgi:hypothetical protein
MNEFQNFSSQLISAKQKAPILPKFFLPKGNRFPKTTKNQNASNRAYLNRAIVCIFTRFLKLNLAEKMARYAVLGG